MNNIPKKNVLNIISTLNYGGAERIALNIANNLPSNKFKSFLGVTREGGEWEELIHQEVEFVNFKRKNYFDINFIIKMKRFLKKSNIDIIHAHQYSIFISLLMKIIFPRIKVIWHNHMSNLTKQRIIDKKFILAAHFSDAIIVASSELYKWTIEKLKANKEKVFFYNNFIDTQIDIQSSIDLPGKKNRRVVCISNFRKEKDQINLIKAFNFVRNEVIDAKLIIIGNINDTAYYEQVICEIKSLGLEKNVVILGPQKNIYSILRNCSIGALNSKTEAFPLTLLEYGISKLAVITTSVGECPAILKNGEYGLLVKPESPIELATSIISLLKSSKKRNEYRYKFYENVLQNYSIHSVLQNYIELYENITKV